jgi:hypothetical protein
MYLKVPVRFSGNIINARLLGPPFLCLDQFGRFWTTMHFFLISGKSLHTNFSSCPFIFHGRFFLEFTTLTDRISSHLNVKHHGLLRHRFKHGLPPQVSSACIQVCKALLASLSGLWSPWCRNTYIHVLNEKKDTIPTDMISHCLYTYYTKEPEP